MEKIYLFGASGQGKVVKQAIESRLSEVSLVFIDEDKKKEGTLFEGVPVIGPKAWDAQYPMIVTVGNNLIRKAITKRHQATFVKAIHSSAIIAPQSDIGEGSVVMAGVVINPGSMIGKHCIINTASVVEHDCIIEDYVHISPNSTLAGNVKVGEGTHLGIGASVLPNITIGKWAIIGAGSVVLQDVPDHAVVVGVPGRIVKYKKNIDG
ncbi:acetyltransferase [Sungkyunkwania multivorans]|uniref:Acetyltransferase n=1 Tax=Sungkyunkwania multivorans TaxID=1173618 RepID=A0ABW3D1W5_9FLAO